MTNKAAQMGYLFTFGVKDAPPDQITFVATSEAEAQKAANAYKAEHGHLSAILWEVLPAPKVVVVSGNSYLPIADESVAQETQEAL